MTEDASWFYSDDDGGKEPIDWNDPLAILLEEEAREELWDYCSDEIQGLNPEVLIAGWQAQIKADVLERLNALFIEYKIRLCRCGCPEILTNKTHRKGTRYFSESCARRARKRKQRQREAQSQRSR